jgi:hypothetical protein
MDDVPRFSAAEIFNHEHCDHPVSEGREDCAACIFHRAYQMGVHDIAKRMEDYAHSTVLLSSRSLPEHDRAPH